MISLGFGLIEEVSSFLLYQIHKDKNDRHRDEQGKHFLFS